MRWKIKALSTAVLPSSKLPYRDEITQTNRSASSLFSPVREATSRHQKHEDAWKSSVSFWIFQKDSKSIGISNEDSEQTLTLIQTSSA